MASKEMDMGALAELRKARDSAKVPVGEGRRVREDVESRVVETGTIAARVPYAKARAYSAHVIEAQRYFPKLEKQTAIEALLDMLDDPEFFQRWLDQIEVLRNG